MWVEDSDYLRILEGGNFINFVAMVVHKADKLSVVKTNNFRLKVSGVYTCHATSQERPLRTISFLSPK